MNIRKKLGGVAVALAVLSSGLMFAAQPASAAPQPTIYPSVWNGCTTTVGQYANPNIAIVNYTLFRPSYAYDYKGTNYLFWDAHIQLYWHGIWVNFPQFQNVDPMGSKINFRTPNNYLKPYWGNSNLNYATAFVTTYTRSVLAGYYIRAVAYTWWSTTRGKTWAHHSIQDFPACKLT
jgi:hypothetical protein